MKKIGISESWVEVESGFGGLAIYKAELFKKYDYAKDVKSNQESEHVTLHLKLRNDKKRIFINPKFVNSYWNTYNINKFFFIRQIRRLVYESKMLYSIFRKMAR
jgi:hypothetical protein